MSILLEELKQIKLLELNFFGIDISISNGVITVFAAAFLVILFYSILSRRAKIIPDSLQGAVEYIIQFIREEMLAPLGREGESWIPFVVALFSFILTCNLLGLIPGLLPPTSNINVTATLAVMVFVITQAAGFRKHGFIGYIRTLFPVGIPLVVAIFLFPIEIIGQLARPFSLAIRLFANMFAGHAIILTLLGLIYVFKSYLVIPFPVMGTTAILAFEIFVSFIQAFIFAFLSASYIVGALKTEH